MKRFLVQDVPDGEARIRLTDREAHHARDVLRLKTGDGLILVDGRGREWTARIAASDRSGVEADILEQRESASESPLELTLGMSLIKGDRMDWIVQKATELGLTRFIPVAVERAVVRLPPERAGDRVEKWRRISGEAVKQCRRGRPVDILPVADLRGFLEQTADAALKIVPHVGPEAGTGRLPDLLAAHSPVDFVAVLIGPEGGFTPDEADAAGRAGFHPVRLGPRIMRAETAALAALSVLQYGLGDLG